MRLNENNGNALDLDSARELTRQCVAGHASASANWPDHPVPSIDNYIDGIYFNARTKEFKPGHSSLEGRMKCWRLVEARV